MSLDRDDLPLLGEADQRRLVEKWINRGLADEELALLPADLSARVQSHFRRLVEDGLRSAEKGGWIDGPEAVERMLGRIGEQIAPASRGIDPT